MTNSLAVSFTCLCSFLTSHTYQGLKGDLGEAGIFWLYGAISVVGLAFIAATVPETKGKTEAEVRNAKKKKRAGNCKHVLLI